MHGGNPGRGGKIAHEKEKYIFLAAIVPFFLLTLMYELIPVVMTLIKSLQTDSGFGLDNYAAVFAGQYYLKSIRNSLNISLCSSLIGIVVAFLGGYAAFSSPIRTRGVFSTILNIAANFAGVPLAFSYMILLGNSGIIVARARDTGYRRLPISISIRQAGLC